MRFTDTFVMLSLMCLLFSCCQLIVAFFAFLSLFISCSQMIVFCDWFLSHQLIIVAFFSGDCCCCLFHLLHVAIHSALCVFVFWSFVVLPILKTFCVLCFCCRQAKRKRHHNTIDGKVWPVDDWWYFSLLLTHFFFSCLKKFFLLHQLTPRYHFRLPGIKGKRHRITNATRKVWPDDNYSILLCC